MSVVAIDTVEAHVKPGERTHGTGCDSGAADSFERLYRDYAPRIRALCAMRLHDGFEAEDACHETLLRAHQHIGQLRRDADPWPWLSTIARNVCTDIHRARARLTPTDQPASAEVLSPEEEADRRARSDVVADAIRRLPGRYRTHLWWRDCEGWSYGDIAAASGTTVGAVRSVLSRAREELRSSVRAVAVEKKSWPLPAVIGAAAGLLRRIRLTVRAAAHRAATSEGSVLMANAVLATALAGSLAGSGGRVPERRLPTPTVAAAVQAMPSAITIRAAAPSPPPAVQRVARSAGSPSRPGSAPETPRASRVATPSVNVSLPAAPDAVVRVGPLDLSCTPDPATGDLGHKVCGALPPTP